ncbi:MAG: OadG family protein [Thermodesulfobacteriota bacterium]
MNFSLAEISFDNLITPEFNAVFFSIFGMIMVFAGLFVISIYIAVLPKLLALPSRLKKRAVKNKEESEPVEKDILLAIAVALHLQQDFPEENEKITWKSHGDLDSPWKISGRVHGLSVRSHAGRSALSGR